MGRIRTEDLDNIGEPPAAWASDEAFKQDWDNQLDAEYDLWNEPEDVKKYVHSDTLAFLN